MAAPADPAVKAEALRLTLMELMSAAAVASKIGGGIAQVTVSRWIKAAGYPPANVIRQMWAVALYRSGMIIKDIAATVQAERHEVSKWIKTEGLEVPSEKKSAESRKVVAMRNGWKMIPEIAKETGKSPQQVKDILLYRDLGTRDRKKQQASKAVKLALKAGSTPAEVIESVGVCGAVVLKARKELGYRVDRATLLPHVLAHHVCGTSASAITEIVGGDARQSLQFAGLAPIRTNGQTAESPSPSGLRLIIRNEATNTRPLKMFTPKTETKLVERLIYGLHQRFVTERAVKRDRGYRLALSQLMAAIARSGRCGLGVNYSRDKNKISQSVLAVVDWLGDIGAVTNTKMEPRSKNVVQSWLVPSPYLLDVLLKGDAGRGAEERDDGGLCFVWRERGSDGEWLDADAPAEHMGALVELGAQMASYNSMVARAEVLLDGRQMECRLRRIFNGSITLGGRMYGGDHQTTPSIDRARILIDGEPTVEIDYNAMHPNLLIALSGSDAVADPYQSIADAASMPRSAVKGLLLRLLNCSCLPSFHRIATLSGNPDVQAMAASGREFPGFFEGVPAGLCGETFTGAVFEAFPLFLSIVGQPDTGLMLQWHDSTIMAAVLAQCVAEGIVALPVHDSVIVPQSHRERVIEIMKAAYTVHTGGRLCKVA